MLLAKTILEGFPDCHAQVFHFVKQAQLLDDLNLTTIPDLHVNGQKQLPEHVISALRYAHPAFVAFRTLEALLGTPVGGDAKTVRMKGDEERQIKETDSSDSDEALIQLETALLSATPGIVAVIARSGRGCFSQLISRVAGKLASPIPFFCGQEATT